MKRIKINVLVVAMLVLCAALSMGCTDKPLDTPASVFVEKPESGQTVVGSEQYDDEEFLEWLSEYLDEDMANTVERIEKAENGDSKGLAICGIKMQACSARGLDEIDDFEVSLEWRPFAREFKKYMEDCYMQGVYMESGWRDLNFDDIDLGIEYGEKAIIHLERAIDGNK